MTQWFGDRPCYFCNLPYKRHKHDPTQTEVCVILREAKQSTDGAE